MPISLKKHWKMQQVVLADLLGELYLPPCLPWNGVSPETTSISESTFLPVHRPALVIMPSSAGVCDVRERYYARYFSKAGFVCLIVDSFMSRELTPGINSQEKLSDTEMLEDALSAWRFLAKRKDINSEQIAILGVSRGGTAALNSAMHSHGPEHFAAHVAIAPSALIQPRHPVTTGSPILMLIAEKDDFTGVQPALCYAERLQKEGGNITVHIVPEACHAWESCGKTLYYPEIRVNPTAIFLLEEDGSYTNEQTGENLSETDFQTACAHFPPHGAHAGGGTPALKASVCLLIEDFLAAHGLHASSCQEYR